ncbi:hypothetical protein L207DRAFT_588599 [Hyaloscypha variabilis F]|uniref:Peptidase A1 domain-containing protein n=1 Tax=Hyaloscypha variabilis (strain UAMH 11265 / GT02V1 / F) TaxID=1149755 RepID=A0A2J6R9D6_HYAVF|nr:hypothetical protein L207DRAFT_588599 [Hyaloscypha variabilis F]
MTISALFVSLASLLAIAIVPPPTEARSNTVCAIPTDSSNVTCWNGASWDQIGGAAYKIYGGGYGLLGVTSDNSAVFLWQSGDSSSPLGSSACNKHYHAQHKLLRRLASRLPRPSLSLPGLVHQIQVDFSDGDHTFTSPDFELGAVHSLGAQPVMGRLSFHYSYDERSRTITVCGTDYASAKGMALITSPRDIEEVCVERAAAGAGFEADDFHCNRAWNYRT